MTKQAVLIGIGEIGGVFAKGCLKSNYTVTPINRDSSISDVLSTKFNADLVLNTVGEKDLDETLVSLKETNSDNLVLVQNELLPSQWLSHSIDPTVISIWFEKKPGKDPKQIIPSPVYGVMSKEITQVLNAVGIDTKILTTKADLLFELVLKNVYILTTNICGLKTKNNVGDLKENHYDFMISIFNEVVTLQEALTSETFDHDLLLKAMIEAMDGDLEHQCMGRSAPDRLQRAKESAQELNLSLTHIFKI